MSNLSVKAVTNRHGHVVTLEETGKGHIKVWGNGVTLSRDEVIELRDWINARYPTQPATGEPVDLKELKSALFAVDIAIKFALCNRDLIGTREDVKKAAKAMADLDDVLTRFVAATPAAAHGDGAVRLYNAGYKAGHHDTVEGRFIDIHRSDMGSYHSEEVGELLRDIAAMRAQGDGEVK